MEMIKALSSQAMIDECIRKGLKSIDIAEFLNVNPSTITKVRTGMIKNFKADKLEQLVILYDLTCDSVVFKTILG